VWSESLPISLRQREYIEDVWWSTSRDGKRPAYGGNYERFVMFSTFTTGTPSTRLEMVGPSSTPAEQKRKYMQMLIPSES
jgi:hypothetical protein